MYLLASALLRSSVSGQSAVEQEKGGATENRMWMGQNPHLEAPLLVGCGFASRAYHVCGLLFQNLVVDLQSLGISLPRFQKHPLEHADALTLREFALEPCQKALEEVGKRSTAQNQRKQSDRRNHRRPWSYRVCVCVCTYACLDVPLPRCHVRSEELRSELSPASATLYVRSGGGGHRTEAGYGKTAKVYVSGRGRRRTVITQGSGMLGNDHLPVFEL